MSDSVDQKSKKIQKLPKPSHPAKHSWYKLKQHKLNPQKVVAPAESTTSNYDGGFAPTSDVWPLIPNPPGEGLNFRIFHDKLQVGVGQNDDEIMSDENDEMKNNALELMLYRGTQKSNQKDDGVRFVYIPKPKSKSPDPGNFFIRKSDLELRMMGDKNIFISDFEMFNKNKAPFPLWDCKGYVDSSLSTHLGTRLNSKQLSFLKEEAMSDEKETQKLHWALSHFVGYTEMLRNATGEVNASGNPYGRFWDYSIDTIESPDHLDPHETIKEGFHIIFDDKVVQKLRGELETDGEICSDESIRKALSTMVGEVLNIKALKFKPGLDERNIWWGKAWKPNPLDSFTTLENHPGELYTIAVSAKVLGALLCAPVSFLDNPFQLPGEGAARELDRRMDKAHCIKKGGETNTNVTKAKVESAETRARDETQGNCMHSKGYSANDAAYFLWGTDLGTYLHAQKPKLFAEWLHRSAWSFGNMTYEGSNGEATPQTVYNLVLGSRESNTVMMRFEEFIKRIVKCSTNPNGETSVQVTTRIVYGGAVNQKPHEWIRTAEFTWLAPILQYEYCITNPGDDMPSKYTRDLKPLNREHCMLFQVWLDKRIEKFMWNWDCFKTTGNEDTVS